MALRDTVPLHEAAALAYLQRLGTRSHRILPSNDELDLVALALSTRLEIYGAQFQELSTISASHLMHGMFWGGARRFELRSVVPPFRRFAVRRADLERVLDGLKGEASEAWQDW